MRVSRMPTPILAVVLAAAMNARVDADVLDSHASGFRVQIKADVEGSRQQVYDAVVGHVAEWWDAKHTYSGDATNLYFEAKEKGWFGEKLPDGGFVCHMRIVYLRPGKAVRLIGGLGPLQEMGIDGALTIDLAEAADGRTAVTLSYNVSGYDPNGLDKLAAPVDGVLSDQVQRLKRFVEKGTE